MNFANFSMIHLSWLVIGLGVFLYWASVHKKRMMRKFAEARFIDEIVPAHKQMKKDNQWCMMIIFTVLILSILSLMRPQWGFRLEEVKRQGLDIMLVMDVSKSMLTQDVKPNRLERSKLAVKELIRKLKGDRVGLVAFAGTAFSVCPLTVDYNGFMMSLDDLSPDTIPRGGTALNEAIKEAVKSYKDVPSQYRAVVIMTDGENLEGDPLKEAEAAKKKGIKIFCIGIGTEEGELVRVTNERGEEEFLKDKEGHVVKSKLNEKLMQEMALMTDGAYVRSSGAQFGLDYIYEKYLSSMERREIKSEMAKKYFDRFQIPLALAFVLLCIESLIGVNLRRKKEMMSRA
ncbi:MAG TPA: hypothetical protein DD723_09910 [Candidatus Omnitrophica bacterium]|nr:hypothetical protein [Candidatus Omnitrophota bacterium]